MDSGQRRHRRHRGGNSNSNNSSGNLLRGGGIFSLPTPFQQQLVNDDDDDDDVATSRSSSSCRGDGGNKNGGGGDDDSSILRVCDSRSSNKNDQASSSSLSSSNDNAAVDANARASAVDEDTAIEDRGNDNADDGFHKCHNNQQQRIENECRKAGATTLKLALEGEVNNNTDFGHDDDDDYGGSCGSSVDLLADDDDDDGSDENNNNDKNSLQQHHPHDRNVDAGQPIATVQSSSLSPISPATKTLDRLSQFSSAKGGAELCMHLLADAAATVYASDAANNVGATIRGKSVENNGLACHGERYNVAKSLLPLIEWIVDMDSGCSLWMIPKRC